METIFDPFGLIARVWDSTSIDGSRPLGGYLLVLLVVGAHLIAAIMALGAVGMFVDAAKRGFRPASETPKAPASEDAGA